MELTLLSYLTVQIQQIIEYGSLHTLTWASRQDLDHRLQLCVHDGPQAYISVHFQIGAEDTKQIFDRALGGIGWSVTQADNSLSLYYYVTPSKNQQQLFYQAEDAAKFCEKAMFLIWHAKKVCDIALLGARGPYIPLQIRENEQSASLPIAA